MKTFRVVLPLLLILFVFHSDFRMKNQRSLYRDFIGREQNSFKVLENYDENEKMFTGIQYAALQEYYKTLDPSELRVPMERLGRAMIQTQAKKSAAAFSSSNEFKMEWLPLDSDLGGRVRALMWDPNDPEYKKVWTAGVTGGLWSREDIYDSGERWKPVDDFWPGLAVSCLEYDPVDPLTFYAGTGEGQTARIIYRESSGRGFGIMKSTDGGENWTLIESTKGFAYVTDIAIKNEGENGVIYAGVVSGEYQGQVYSSSPGDGLYRSVNGGESWTQVLPDVPGTDHSYAPSDIEITANGRIFVGTGLSQDKTGAGNILFSDDGINWNVFNDYADTIANADFYNFAGRVMLTSAPSDGNIVYAVLTAAGGSFYSFKSPRGVHMIKTTDGGQNWSKVSPPFDDGRGSWAYIAWHALAIAVNPDNPDKLYAGGLDLYSSDNATSSWYRVSSWYNFDNAIPEEPDYVHADHHTIRFRPGSATDAIFTTDGGVFLTQNAKASVPDFMEVSQGLNTLQYYTCAMHPAESKHHFLAGAQDNGTLFYRESGVPVSVLSNVSYGDGTFCFIDENEPDLQLTSSQFNYIYSTENSIAEGYMENTVNYFQGGIFNNPMDYDSKKNHLFCNGCDFFGNMADTLIRIINFNGVATRLFIPLNMGVTVPLSAIKVSPHTTETTTLFTGTQDGRLFKVENADYLKVNKNPPLTTEIGSVDFPASNIVCIDIGKNEDQILVIFSNYGIPSVWETRDGGQSWSNKESDLPDLPVRWGIYHPVNAKQVLLATEIGLWATMNIMDEPVVWEPVADFPNVRVDMLKVRKSDNAVIAATHGRGLWYSPQFPLNVDQDIKTDNEVKLYPNPTSGLLKISTGVFQKENLELRVYNQEGKLILEIPEFISIGDYSSEINLINFRDGVYFISLVGDSSSYSSKVIVRK